MKSSCIITDNAAQFSRSATNDNTAIHLINHRVDLGKRSSIEIQKIKIADLPKWVSPTTPPTFAQPDKEEITALLLSLYQTHDDIFLILLSRALHPAYDLIESIVNGLHGKATFHLIDSQTIGLGEGQLVQLAADLIRKGVPAAVIEEKIRKIIPHIYTLFCTPNLSYLNKSGFIDIGQSTAGEMMSLSPIFSLEDGKLNPLDKVKNIRNVIDYFLEFLDEFDDLESVYFIQPSPPAYIESKLIRQKVEETFPHTVYSEHTINPFLASLIGPRGYGIVISEKTVD